MTATEAGPPSPPDRAMVLLVGGRPVPNVAAVLRYRPQRVAWLVSQDAKDTYELTRQVLERVPGLALAEPHWVPAYDLAAGRDACQAIVAALSGAEVVFNLTCGTKVMALAAYDVARDKGLSALYLDTAEEKDVLLCGPPVDLAPVDRAVTGSLAELGRVDVPTYLAVYGRRAVTEGLLGQLPAGEERALALAHDLVAWGPAVPGELSRILHNHPDGKPHAIRSSVLGTARRDVVLLLHRLHDEGWIADLAPTANWQAHFTIASPAARRFLGGTWLEAFVHRQACACGAFDDCLLGLSMPGEGAQNEVDVAAIRAGRLLVCSCKTARTVYQDAAELDKLRAVTGMIGGRYVGKMLVTNQLPPAAQDRRRKSYGNWVAQAAQRQIVVVTGEQLGTLRDILVREATRPSYRSM